MIPADYHLHSTHSADGRGSVLEMCEAALEHGLRDICFAEHFDFDRSDPAYGFLDYDGFAASIAEARDRYAGRLTIRMGLEFDFRREYGDEPREVLATMAFDFLMGSVHSAAGMHIYDVNREQLECLDVRALQEDYFVEIEALVVSGLCDCLGHFDYVYKQHPEFFGAHRDAWYWERVDKVLAKSIARKVALEVNTQHVLDRGFGLAADAEILGRYRLLGGRLVTVGSDAHRPGDVAHGYPAAEKALAKAGFQAVTGFQKRRSYEIALRS